MQLTGTNQSESYSLALIKEDVTLYNIIAMQFPRSRVSLIVSGADGGGVTPVPIPNTAVKPTNADGTATAGLLGE